jgi:hypothetical protein
MKRTTLKDTVATYNDELSVIMATGDATTIEEASHALAECGGNNVDRALGLVHNQAPPPTSGLAASQNLHNAPCTPSRKARHTKEEAEPLQKEHESYELKWAGEKDAEAYKESLAKQRRDSFAFRNQKSHDQRVETTRRQAEEKKAQHESYELKWAGERDADAYQKRLEQERRDSFVFRNKEGQNQRLHEEQRELETRNIEHESYELKWAGERDADACQKRLEQERRDSFAFRNKEGQNQRLHEEQRELEARNIEHESYELKWAGERDADAYQKRLEQERRDSFAFRNKEGRRQREDEAIRIAREQQMEHESYELKRAGEKDAGAYKKKLEQEQRDSFKFRKEEGTSSSCKGDGAKSSRSRLPSTKKPNPSC